MIARLKPPDQVAVISAGMSSRDRDVSIGSVS